MNLQAHEILRIKSTNVLPVLLMPVVFACTDAEPITPPQQMPGSPFHYPEELWDAGVEGETVLRLRVNATGMVDSVEVESASEHAAFDTAAIRGARDLHFEPARQADSAVATWVLLPVQFNLPSADSAGGIVP